MMGTCLAQVNNGSRSWGTDPRVSDCLRVRRYPLHHDVSIIHHVSNLKTHE